jgi:hypothetical protein
LGNLNDKPIVWPRLAIFFSFSMSRPLSTKVQNHLGNISSTTYNLQTVHFWFLVHINNH